MTGTENQKPPSTPKYLNAEARLFSVQPILNAIILILSGVQILWPVVLLLNTLSLTLAAPNSEFCFLGTLRSQLQVISIDQDGRGEGVQGGWWSCHSIPFVVLPFLP